MENPDFENQHREITEETFYENLKSANIQKSERKLR